MNLLSKQYFWQKVFQYCPKESYLDFAPFNGQSMTNDLNDLLLDDLTTLSVTRKKSPNVYKTCPKLILL